MRQDQEQHILRPSLIAGTYVLVALAWIIFSGMFLQLFIDEDAHFYAEAEQIKGAAFVLVTGGLLYLALKRLVRSVEKEHTRSQRLAQFAELSPNAVIELGPRGEVLYANHAAHNAAEALGVSVEQFVPSAMDGPIRWQLDKGSVIDNELHMVGGREWRWSLFPVASPPGAYAYGYDHTEERRLELQVQHAARMESVGRLAAGVTHDMNNILTAIGGHNALLEMEVPPDSPCREEIEGIKYQIKRASELARSLLLVSRRPDANGEPEPCDITAEFEGYARTVRHLLPSRIKASVEPAPGPLVVEVDRREMERALLNLAANAADAIDGAGEVTLRLDRDGPDAVVEVRDTGQGIPSDVLPHIFDPFFTTKAEGHGTGLGLASVHAFVTRSNGRIDVQTEPGQGTTFRIRLPLLESAGGQAQAAG